MAGLFVTRLCANSHRSGGNAVPINLLATRVPRGRRIVRVADRCKGGSGEAEDGTATSACGTSATSATSAISTISTQHWRPAIAQLAERRTVDVLRSDP